MVEMFDMERERERERERESFFPDKLETVE